MSAGWLVVTVLGWLALLGAVLALRAREQRRLDASRKVLRLHFPRQLDADSVAAFVRTLVALGRPAGPLAGRAAVVFEVAATPGRLEHRLRLPAGGARQVLAQLRAAVPDLVTEPLSEERSAPLAVAVELGLSSRERALRIDQPAAAVAALLAGLQPLNRGERLVVQWVVGAVASVVPAPPPVTRRQSSASLIAALAHHERERVTAAERRDKHREPVLGAVGRVGAAAATPARAQALLRRAVAVLPVVERPGVHFRPRRLPGRLVAGRTLRAGTPLVAFPAVLNARELAIMVAWPVGGASVAGLAAPRSQLLAPDADVASRGRVIGASDVPGVVRPVAVSVADSLQHLHVVGPTGVGKTTLLGSLAAQDIQAGRSVVVIDPKGDLVAHLLDRIPPEREGDVILLDPTDDARPVGLNLLEGAHQAPERVTDLVVGLFHRLYAASWGPRTADVLGASLLTLAQVPGQTLCELPVLLTGEAFRRRLVGRIDDPVALSPFWAWYESLSPGERAAVIGPVMNKLRAFLLRRRIRAVIGQAAPAWHIEDVLNRRRVLLVSLAKGELGGEAAALMGALVVARLWQAIQRRTVRLPAFVYIDEFQDVLHLPTDLADVLAQARSFGVGLTLAHQHLGQLDGRLKAAVLANARSRVVFQTGADDAAFLARQLGGGLTPADLMGLAPRAAYATLCAGGATAPPASLRTAPLPAPLGTADQIRAASRERFGRDRGEVEAAIAARHGGRQSAPNGQLGKRRRAS